MDIPEIPPLLVPDSSPIVRLANLIASPLFGNITSSLHSLPSNRDTASKSGCRSQFYTSWNVSSRSFVSSIYYTGLYVVASTLPPTTAPDRSTVTDVNVGASSRVQTQQQTTRLLNVSIPELPGEPSAWSPDILPARIVKINSESHYYERNIPISYSRLFKTMEKILSGTHVPGTTNHDVRYLSLTKYLHTAKGSKFEVAPLVRLGCMSLSISKHCYETEIITRRIIRGFEQTAYLGCEITQETKRTPVSKILACTLEAFITFMINNCSGSMDPDNIFQFDQIDQEWTAVPISNKFLKRRSAVPYIASFLTTEFFNGKVNHVYRGYYANAMGTKKSEAVVIRTIPAANSVHLKGPKNVILVLVDNANTCTNSNIKLFSYDVPVYTGSAQVNPVLFGQIWDAWWCNNMLNNIERDVMFAMNEVEKHLAVKNAADIATSMLAELYSAAYLGLGVQPDEDNITYNWEVPVSGGWSLYRNDTIASDSRAKLNYWSRADGDDRRAGRRRIASYNFSALTSWHQPSTGRVFTESQQSIFPNAGKMHVWSSNVPDYKFTSFYLITTVPSMTRICFYVKLLLTHGNQTNNKSCLGSRIHLLSMIMGAQTSLIFSQTNLSLPVWSGYISNLRTFPTHNTLIASVVNFATLGIFIQKNLHHFGLFFTNNEVSEYYSIHMLRNMNWYSYSPYPHHFVQQWSAKINTLIGKQGEIKFLLVGEQSRITGIMHSKDALQYRSKTACTINADQYFPLVYFINERLEDQSMSGHFLMAWVDNWSYLSNISAVGDVGVNKAGLESNEFVFPTVYCGINGYRLIKSILIMFSSYTNYDTQETHFSDIEWYIPNRCR